MSQETAPGPVRDTHSPRDSSAPAVDGDLEPRPPLGRYLMIQADQFCACGYNLHGQRVSFDERLEFPIVRCPECGKWHPAGHGSTALRPWLALLATVCLALWVGVLLVLGATTMGVLVGMQFGYLSFDTTYAYVDVTSGRPAEQRSQPDGSWVWVFSDTGETADNQAIRLEIRTVPITKVTAAAAFGRTQAATASDRAIFCGVVVLITLIAGALQSAAMWHVRGMRRLLPPLLVIGAAAGLYWMVITRSGSQYGPVRGMATSASAIVLGAAVCGWLAGLLIGRTIFRGVVMALVPPRPRMMLAFLWLADGKQPPSANDQA